MYKFIKQHEGEWPVELMCKVLQVSRSSYYNWRHNPVGIREIKKESMKASIRKAYFDAHGYYGSP